jgi:hypothetical protein
MRNQTIKKDPNNRGRLEPEEHLRSIWLCKWFHKITLEDMICIDTESISELITPDK